MFVDPNLIVAPGGQPWPCNSAIEKHHPPRITGTMLAKRFIPFSPDYGRKKHCHGSLSNGVLADETRIDTAVVFHTAAGRHYAAERSIDLTAWTTVQDAEDILGVSGSMTV